MGQIFDADDSNFDAEVMKSDRPVMVDFSATWCGPCKKLEPLVDEIAAEYDGRLKVVKVDVDRARDTAAKFSVLAVPTLLFFRDGQIRDELRGLVAKRVIAERVEKVL